MAIPKIKATYSLEQKTVGQLEDLARRWGVSKSEALRRAISMAATAPAEADAEGLIALDQAQQALSLTDADVDQWVSRTRDERRASSRKRER